MAARKSGLGRGLEALFPVEHPSVGFAELELEEISRSPQQPRSRFDDDSLGELAASIREVGVLQPVIVRPGDTDGTYVLIAGERRLRAADMAGRQRSLRSSGLLRVTSDTSPRRSSRISNVRTSRRSKKPRHIGTFWKILA